MGVYRINKTRLAELVDRTINKVVEADLTGVTGIRNRAFSDCPYLTSITIPNSVTRIYGRAFVGCITLESITIPASVTRIDTSTFEDCWSLSYIKIKNTNPPTLGSNVFLNSDITPTTGSIKVPYVSLEAYKTATNWSVYADRITSYDGPTNF